MKKKVWIVLVLVAVLICVAFIGRAYLNHRATDTAYNYAVEMILNGSYEAALESLEKANPDKFDRESFWYDAAFGDIEGCYKNSIELYAYAMARAEYDLDKAYLPYVNNYLECIPDDYAGDLCEEINEFKESIKPQYEEYLVEKERIRKEQEEEERASYADKLPYEGMDEKFIDDTLMGKHHEYKSEVVGGGMRWETVIHEYRWENIEGDTILYVDCEDGKVKDVIKYGVDYFWTSDGKPIFSAVNPYKHSKKKTTAPKEEKSDPYDVYDYSNPEDFYDDNYDDFFDYYEAEDYYNEHVG